MADRLRDMRKIAHLTTVHSRIDIRIFIKQCCSLADKGYETILVVADGMPDEKKNGVNIYGISKAPGRLQRIFFSPNKVYAKAASLDADIYHLHDPELIPVGLKLKRRGKKVIFDSHEDISQQMLHKPYLSPLLLRIVAGLFSIYERSACRKFDGIITATPLIRDKYLKINPNTTDVNNFPLIGELDKPVLWKEKCGEVCYVGGIGSIRGIREIVKACNYFQTPTRLNLVGKFSEKEVESEVKADPGWMRVNDLGFVDRPGVRDVLSRSIAGLVTFHPLPNHLNAQPNKMFEYMSAGLPVIASNFPLWIKIVKGNDCGLCVDPLDPVAIARAVDYLAKNPDVAHRMGDNGRKAVINKYNWPLELKKLVSFYEGL